MKISIRPSIRPVEVSQLIRTVEQMRKRGASEEAIRAAASVEIETIFERSIRVEFEK